MLTKDVEFDIGLMAGRKLAKKSESMGGLAGAAKEAVNEEQKKLVIAEEETGLGVKKSAKLSGVAGRKIKKAG